jgi:hypothetical protein
LLLNEKIAPAGNVVASGSLYVWPPDPVTTYVGVDAAVKVVVVPAAATLVNPSNKEFAVMLEFASRKTTLFAPDGVVTPVPPLATANVPASVMVPDVVTGPPLVVSPVVPPLMLTLVTVPEPLPPPLVNCATVFSDMLTPHRQA